MTKTEMSIVNAVIKAYVAVMGADKWNSLTADQQHTVIMSLIRDTLNK